MKRVLITPLDWGLGHATRCMPIIEELQKRNVEPIIAGSGDSLTLLQAEYPSLRYFTLPGYAPVYPASNHMALAMAGQIPKFIRTIQAEHQVVRKLVATESIDLIVSDNRYGCWSPTVKSVFITHQSNILMPRRFGWLSPLVQSINHRLIKNFTACWIPDLPGHHSLAGVLGVATFKNAQVEYIGHLTRFVPRNEPEKKLYDIAAIFSGPEPQRSLMEAKILPQLKSSGLKYFVVRGKPKGTRHDKIPEKNAVDFLTSGHLQHLIESSAVIVSRSGFSTVMDLATLGKKAIFIPTPGQPEQHYLAERLMQKQVAYFMDQENFDLAFALKESSRFKGFSGFHSDRSLLVAAIEKALTT